MIPGHKRGQVCAKMGMVTSSQKKTEQTGEKETRHFKPTKKLIVGLGSRLTYDKSLCSGKSLKLEVNPEA